MYSVHQAGLVTLKKSKIKLAFGKQIFVLRYAVPAVNFLA